MPERARQAVAVVGCGYWGINYVRVLSELPEVSSIVAVDGSESRRELIRSRFPDVQVVSSIGQMLEQHDVFAALVATPATLHVEPTTALLEAGKHVLVEKPLTVRATDAMDLVQLAEREGLTLSVGHTFLFNESVRYLKARVDSGECGPIRYLYSRRSNLGPVRQDVNALWDLAPHDVSMFNHLVGSRPRWVSAVGARLLGNEREDVGFASINYENGVVAHLHVSWLDPHKVRELVVVGREERIVFNDLSATEPIRIFKKGVVVADGPGSGGLGPGLVVSEGGIFSPQIPAGEPLKNQVRAFLDDVRLGNRPFSDGRVGVRVVEVMEAMNASVAEDGAPIEVPNWNPSGGPAA